MIKNYGIYQSIFSFKSSRITIVIKVDDICKLIEKFYHADFDEDERISFKS